MKVAIFSTHRFEKDHLLQAAVGKHEFVLINVPLSPTTAVLAQGCKAVCVFVNDDGSKEVLEKLASIGVQFFVLRSAGFNHVNLTAAKMYGIKVARVPEYSPYAVAEHTVALMMALNRKLIKANNRIKEANFSLDGLMGFDMHGKTAGIIGTGKIGKVVANILLGFGCKVVTYDPFPDKAWAQQKGTKYLDIDALCETSDVITLHCPLTEETKYLINTERINKTKQGVMLINTSRGGLINTKDVITGLKNCRIGYLGLDVYEEEKGLIFEDHSEEILLDDKIARLMTFPNVLISSHQAFLTDTALHNIAEITVNNLDAFEQGLECKNEVS